MAGAKLPVVPVTQLHIEHTRHRISILRRKGSGEEIGIAQHLAAQRRQDAATQHRKVGKVVRIGYLHIFHPPLQQMRRIAMNGNPVARNVRSYSGKRTYQACRIIHTAGIAAGFFYTEHAGAGDCHPFAAVDLFCKHIFESVEHLCTDFRADPRSFGYG